MMFPAMRSGVRTSDTTRRGFLKAAGAAVAALAMPGCRGGNPGTSPVDGEWLAFPDPAKFKVLGLPWFDENKPNLWRMPGGAFNLLPEGVRNRCRAPAGGRILLRSDTGRLSLRVLPAVRGAGRGFDVYVDGRHLRSAVAEKPGVETDLVLCDGLPRTEKEFLVYLPYHQEVIVRAVGVDRGAKFGPPERAFARPLPVVFYGSSVCQGTAASRPGATYEAVLCRELNLDYVGLGFGGAGKAEAEVVARVNSIPACAYVFDLGKSYGDQDGSAYRAMLAAVRAAHPGTPLICVTPITSARETSDAGYAAKSVHVREVVREAALGRIRDGDRNLLLVEGPDLLGFADRDVFSKDGVHPNDAGFALIARRLRPVLKQALGL